MKQLEQNRRDFMKKTGNVLFATAVVLVIALYPLQTIADGSAVTQTKTTQAAITPQKALQMLKEGNTRFVQGNMLERNLMQQVKTTGSRPIHVRAVGESPIATIEIVRNGEDWRSMSFDEQDIDWEVEDSDIDLPAWYYARVTRADGEMAWSSPVWVDSQ